MCLVCLGVNVNEENEKKNRSCIHIYIYEETLGGGCSDWVE